jgi:hypothetical protein
MFNDNENNPFDLANDEINTDRNNLLKTNENNNNEDKERIKKLSIELAKELVDKKTLQTYGTSFNEGMTHDYIKTLEKKYYILKKEFDIIDNNSDHKLSFEELENFFSNKKINNIVIDRNYIERLFFLLGKEKDNEISIEEFIIAYIKLEEKLKLKNKKLQYLLNELKENLKEYNERMQKTKNEILNKDGICENASLSITLFEAKDIIPLNINELPNTFVIFSVEGKKQKSNIIENSLNPQFFEDFTFPITKRGETLKVELYEQNQILGNQLIGYVDIDLFLYEHQQKTENWYSLKINNESPEGNGSIHLRLRYIYNWYKYYSDLVDKTQLQIKRLKEDINELNKYSNLINQPFGIILAGEINNIIEKRVFEKSEDILDYIFSTRKSIYVMRDSVIQRKPSVTLNPSETNYVNFNRKTILLIYICLILSSLEFLNRCDYLSLLLMIGLFIVLKRNNKKDTDTYCEYLVRGVLISVFFDLFYLFLIGGEFRNFYIQNKVSAFLSFIFSFVNLFGKVGLSILLWIRNTQMKMMREKETNKILKSDVHA